MPKLDVERPNGDKSIATLLLAHGAGAPMDSAFMTAITGLLVERELTVVRFEFAYMAARRVGTSRRPPPKMPVLVEAYREALALARRQVKSTRFLIGGKSMGGRVASLIADEEFAAGRVAGCVCLGYPFHPANKPASLRTAHLESMRCPTLIVQGERDALGERAEVEGLKLSNAIAFAWMRDGDHDLKPRKSADVTHDANLETAADAIRRFSQTPTASARSAR